MASNPQTVELKVTLVQMDVATSRPEENLAKAEGWLQEASSAGSQLVCFPEMWTTGFDWSYNAEHAAEHQACIDRVSALARRYTVWVAGSMLALDEGKRVSNTLFVFDPMGNRAAVYRKTHLFTLFGEDRHMAPGSALTLLAAPWGKTGLSICYDVRFPELFRSYVLQGARLQLLPAAFPHPRLEHWRVLVRARAIENQFFMIAPNQVGTEQTAGGEVRYFGNSMVVDPWGEILALGEESYEGLLHATLDLDKVDEVRSHLTALQDRRPDLYRLD
ncbi:MAG: carbon-nitrogen family hydrolase [Armatimonadetes bacterium]|nr:carbon-nitrogen family hydrolase [Armatimonadota bacterium]